MGFCHLAWGKKTQVLEMGKADVGGPADLWLQGFVEYLESVKGFPCRVEPREGVKEIFEGFFCIPEWIERGERRRDLGGADRKRPVPVSLRAIGVIMSIGVGSATDAEAAVLDGHAGERLVQKGDESAPDTAFYEIDRGFPRERVNDVRPDVDLIEGDGQSGDVKGLFRVALEDNKREESIFAVYGRGYNTAGDMLCDSPRRQQIRDIEHVSENHDNGRSAFSTDHNETIILGAN